VIDEEVSKTLLVVEAMAAAMFGPKPKPVKRKKGVASGKAK